MMNDITSVLRTGAMEKLVGREYNIGVGISLGNKWFTPENTVKEIAWASQYAKEAVVPYVGDTIHALNFEARNAMNPIPAMKKARREGQKKIASIEQYILEHDLEFRVPIVYGTWSDLDFATLGKATTVNNYFLDNEEFQNEIYGLIHTHVRHEKRHFSKPKIDLMARYLIDELAENICVSTVNNVELHVWVYHTDNPVTKFFSDIADRKKYTDLYDAIVTEPKAFIVPNLDGY